MARPLPEGEGKAWHLLHCPMPIVEFRKVGYAINGRPLVENISFVIESGETVVFLGRSGSGKTTTLKLINRLLEPTSGEVFVEGKKTTQWDAIRLRRRIGYVIQDVGLFPHFTVHRNVGLVPSLESWPPDKIDSRVHDMLSLVGLEPSRFAGRLPRELSGGQRQRVGVARALAADPAILLLDEPFGALDPITRAEMQREFRDLQKRLGKTMVFVTHDMREAFLLGDRIGLMKDGHLLALIRNTFTGISGVDPAIREAGRAMGMTDGQLLWKVEIPLALSVIFAGIRVATVIAVGVATIAAAVGAGGLGMFIFRGVSMVDSRLILAGAIPAAALALIADFGLGAVQRRFSKLLCLLVIAAGLSSCSHSDRVVVGSKNFTWQVIMD